MKKLPLILMSMVAITLILTVTSCTPTTPAREYMPDMYESTSFKAQKEDPLSSDDAAARVPPEGTIPRGYEPYHYAVNEGDKAEKELKNPLAMTKTNMERGQKIFNTYCIVCHGPKADGSGFVVPPFPRPPSLLTDKIIHWGDGHIFHVITRGQNLMPSYASQIAPMDRWAVILYVRALERASNPTAADMQAAKSGSTP